MQQPATLTTVNLHENGGTDWSQTTNPISAASVA